ncbi:hypothetical protein B0H17DRAFT_454629 [Mycena rosella]|uniref:Chromo domain-containing protein n=1 Tax=Mycena rosella TaxID=1033263 RepID=A0AAD7GYU7_MYCRO|nr:hypothetical protein B0H17DRAFT_454629 [Mycena rosella]
MPGKATKKVRPVRAGKYDARELWKRSPSPAEDWGSDADVDFNLEIVGEEVGYDGEIKYEIEWRNWTRADGTSTTWEGADTTSTHLPTADWEEKRLAELPDRPDVVLWGTTDIANTRTRERKQGYDGTVSEEERAAFQEDFDGMVSRMDELMEENKEQFPEMYARYTREKQGAGARAETPPTAAPTMPLPRQHYAQVNAQAGPSRPRVNAEAGPSRTSSTPSTSRPSPIQPTASSSRVPAPTSRPPPAQQTASSSSSRPPPPRSPLPRRSSVISISSSADSIQFINMTGPPPIRTKRPATPTPPVGTPAAKRRALPLPPDLVSGAASMSNTTRPSASATPIASSSRPSTSRPPVASSSRTGSNASAASTSATLVASSSRPSTSKPPAAPSSRTSTTFVSACGSGSRLPPLAAFFRGRPSPPAPLPYTLPSHTESAAFWDASTASAAAIRSTRPAADVLPRSSTHPHRDSTPPSTALTRTRQSRSPAQPARRALKRKHPDSDGRTCGCGTLLPPPDVHRGELCDGCRNTATNKRWAMKQTSAPPLPRTCACGTLLPPPDVHRGETCDGCRQSEARARAKGKGKGTQPAALGRGVGVNTMQSGSTHSARALEVVASKTPVRQPLPLPLPGSSSMRKGKARENVKSL